MFFKGHTTRTLALALSLSLTGAGLFFPAGVSAQESPASRPRRTDQSPQETPKPSPTPKEGEEIQEDEVVRVETDLTNILFTAVDKSKRFITTLRQEDVTVTEDGQPQEIFTFARQTDLPLSLAILIDTSISEERTLPIEKAAAASFVDAVLRPDKDEVAVISFTGDSTLEQNLTGNVSRLRRALERVEFVPPSGYIGN